MYTNYMVAYKKLIVAEFRFAEIVFNRAVLLSEVVDVSLHELGIYSRQSVIATLTDCFFHSLQHRNN